MAQNFYDRNKKDFYVEVRVEAEYTDRSEYTSSECFDQWTDLYYYCKNNNIEVEMTGKATVEPSKNNTKADWVYENDGWYYYNNDGSKLKGWTLVKGVWYYLDPSTGRMQTGWHEINGKWYYLNTTYSGLPNGAMLTGWWPIGNGHYYFYTNNGYHNGRYVEKGEMAVNTTIDGYKIASDGKLQP